MATEFQKELDLQRVTIWLGLNYLMALSVPLQIAGRYLLANAGRSKPASASDWWMLSLGIMSLFAALFYEWRYRRLGTLFGSMLCISGIAYFMIPILAYSFHYSLHSPRIPIFIASIFAVGLYTMQFRFIITRFSRGSTDA